MSKIEWTEETWNPTTGCNKVSAGCKNCYAEALSLRLQKIGMKKYKNGFSFKTHKDTLKNPYKWKTSKLVFVNSMSDLFHEEMPLSFLKSVFKVMNETPQHYYQILTKRDKNLVKLKDELTWTDNIWMGVSVENQTFARRVNALRKIPAKVRFLSIEPLIGKITNLNLKNIHWVIVGGESGRNAREMKKEWVLAIHKMCNDMNVPFFFKQWGKTSFNPEKDEDKTTIKTDPQYAKGGCMLEGKVYRALPS